MQREAIIGYDSCVLVVWLCPALCNLMDCSPPGFSIHGIFQTRVLEWVAISFFRGSSWPRDQTCVSCVFCIGRQILYRSATWEDIYNYTCIYIRIYIRTKSVKKEEIYVCTIFLITLLPLPTLFLYGFELLPGVASDI